MPPATLPELPAALLKAAKSCTVRECDAEGDGRFVAYVDEADNTFDVSLRLSKEGQAEDASCECGGRQPCRHIAALMLALSRDEKPQAAISIPKKKAKPKKESPAEALLAEADAESLKAWLRDVFAANKELALAFTHRFGNKDKTFTPEEAATLTLNAVKTVLGKSRNPDATQMKKLLELWKELHAPIINRYAAGPVDEAAFLPLQAALDACLGIHRQYTGSGKVPPYVQRILSGFIPQFVALVQDEAFAAATGLFIRHIPKDYDGIRLYYVVFLNALSESCAAERQQSIAFRIAAQYEELQQRHGEVGLQAYAQAALDMVQRAGIFGSYSDAFRPVRYANAYNVALIKALMGIEKLQAAEAYAWEQIRSNKSSEYNAQYLELLKEIYLRSDNEAGRALVAAELLPQTFDFDDYLLVLANKDEAERKAFRQKIFTRARHMAEHHDAAARFSIRLLAHEANWAKIIGYASDQSTPYSLLLEYFEPLYAFNRNSFLRELIRRRSYTTWLIGWTENEEGMGALAERVLQAYGREELASFIATEEKGGGIYRTDNPFVKKLKVMLAKG